LSYLPLFYDDLDEKVTYIAEKLKNPKAANDLLDKVESAIMERLPMAESFEPYHSVREHRYSYYCIYVDNYIIYSTFPPIKLMQMLELSSKKCNKLLY